ncbi:MAG TPA: hypothetical protein VMV80_06135 [Anaerolineales bacterium]|nr:hypothetical protein [Anaerolineales bacterium]
MEQDSVIRNLSRRIAQLEQAAVANGVSAVEGRYKRAAGAITAGNVYVLKTSATRRIDTTTDEADKNPVVVALNSTDGVHKWARCTNAGYAWVNFEAGSNPTLRDYVVTSTTAGKAKAQSTASSASFGRLVQWDSVNLRGYVLLTREGGDDDACDFVRWYQSSTPSPTANKMNFHEDEDTGHLYYYSEHLEAWLKLTGFM